MGRKINGMLIAGKEVFVGNFLKRNERPSATEWTNVYVKNIPKVWSEEKLNEIMETCGPIASSVIMKDADGKSKGFGFVDFVEHEAAVKCIEDMNKYELDDSEVNKKPDAEKKEGEKKEGEKKEGENK